MHTTKLEFLPNSGGETEGLGDAGIETYKDAPVASCAREAGQNAKDAENIKPVKITFDLIEIDTNSLPGFEKLRSTIKSCISAATQEKDLDFFREAEAVIQNDKIKILRISDFNTKGLVGPSEKEDSPFHSLLKASGISNKDKNTSGGSFGIGKNASFAVSKLRTVYYSTIYHDPNSSQEVFLAQGKVKLVSHSDEDNRKKRATGYWGYEDFSAVSSLYDVPEWMRRQEIGTSIFCVGFDGSHDWKYRMAYSLIVNFFCGIDRGEMVFEIGNGSVKLNANTIREYFNDTSVQDAAASAGHKDDLAFSYDLFKCLRSPHSTEQIFNIPNLGSVQIKVLLDENLPKRVGFIRNGMYITKTLKNFNQSLERFPSSTGFIALVEPKDDAANKLMKDLENPAHNDFSAERISDPRKRAEAKKAMEQLGKKIREIVSNVASPEIKPKVTLDELANLFATEGENNENANGNMESDPENYVYDLKEQIKKNLQKQSGGLGGNIPVKAGTTNSNGAGTGSGVNVNKGSFSGNKSVSLVSNFRNFIDGVDALKRKIFFTSNIDGIVRLKFSASGIYSSENIAVKTVSKGSISDGDVIIHANKNERIEISLAFENEYSGPIEILSFKEDK